jgi:Tol biopolymer transport system component
MHENEMIRIIRFIINFSLTFVITTMKKFYVLILFYSFLLFGFILGATGCADKISTPPLTGSTADAGKIVYVKVDLAQDTTLLGQEYMINADGSNAQLAPQDWPGLENGIISTAKNVVLSVVGIDTIYNKNTDSAYHSENVRLLVSNNDGSNNVHLYSGSHSHRLRPLLCSLSPDGYYAAYVVHDSAGPNRLFVVSTNGGQPVQISANIDEHTGGPPVFSPDSRSIAYYTDTYNGGPGPDTRTIETTHIDGTSVSTLTTITNPGSSESASIAWSPKGDLIAYNDYPVLTLTAYVSLYAIHSDGTQKTLIADTGLSPAWSPTGDTLAYAGSPGDIILTSDLGVTKINITNKPLEQEGDPQWSPDGKKIVCMTGIGKSNSTTSLRLIDVASKTSSIIATPGILPLYLR